MSPAKMAEPINMSFGMWIQVGPWNHITDGGPNSPMGRDNFEMPYAHNILIWGMDSG